MPFNVGNLSFLNLHRNTASFPKSKYFGLSHDSEPIAQRKVMRASILSTSVYTFVAGMVSGVLSRTVTAPLDRLKIIAQVRGASTGLGILSNSTNILTGLHQLFHEGGIRALFRGNLANCIKVGPQGGIQWAVFESLKSRSRLEVKETSLFDRFVCASLAGMVSQGAIYPLETIKTRMAAAPTLHYSGIMNCGLSIVQSSGVRGLYSGIGASLLGRIPYSGFDLSVYDTLKQLYSNKANVEIIPASVLFVCGVCSSICGQVVSYPFMLSRSRLQVQGMSHAHPVIYSGVLDCFRITLRDSGIRGLYSGIGLNLAQCLPAAGIGYVSYEWCKAFLYSLSE